jgi:hypothetical protein
MVITETGVAEKTARENALSAAAGHNPTISYVLHTA